MTKSNSQKESLKLSALRIPMASPVPPTSRSYQGTLYKSSHRHRGQQNPRPHQPVTPQLPDPLTNHASAPAHPPVIPPSYLCPTYNVNGNHESTSTNSTTPKEKLRHQPPPRKYPTLSHFGDDASILNNHDDNSFRVYFQNLNLLKSANDTEFVVSAAVFLATF